MAVKKATVKTKATAKKLGVKVSGRSEAQLKHTIKMVKKGGKKTVAKKTVAKKKKKKATPKIPFWSTKKIHDGARVLGSRGGRAKAQAERKAKRRKK